MPDIKNRNLLQYGSHIDGRWMQGPEAFAVVNPADGSLIAEVANATAKDTETAVAAARKALVDWKARTATERSTLLRRWFDLLIENQEDLAVLLTCEQGKPLAEARGEIVYGASFIEWFAEEAKRVYGDVIPTHSNDRRLVVIKQPVGVVGAITPWNFPNAMITRKAAPALAAGCTFIIKPASETPLSALALAVLAEAAGIPPGVFNVVAGTDAAAIGNVLSTHADVAKFTFTGSTAVGKQLLAQCAGTVKKTSMELGGNAPFIVFDDADLNAAVEGAVASKYRNAGQTCVCANRILVQDQIYDTFAEKLAAAVSTMKVGPGLEPGVEIGPLINAPALQKVTELVQKTLSAGGRPIVGGEPVNGRGLFYPPTVIADVANDMPISQTEIFGPVAPLIRFSTEQEALELANDTPFGLASYFYARDIGRIWRVAEGLEYGMVGINAGIISTTLTPFGGVKESGIGREGSKYGIDEFIEVKTLCMGGI